MTTTSELNKSKMTILCVDDELNILKSMKRLLYKQTYTVLIAESGAAALEIFAEQEIHLVISDMKMPNMSGALFLQKVAVLFPDTYRILLTGFADMESIIDAVNKGKISRYLQKPWDNNELIAAIDEGLEKVNLKYENKHLHSLIAKQNQVLKDLNHTLDERVQLRTKQIRIALKKIEGHKIETQKVLYNLISINPYLDGRFANSVSQLSERIAQTLELPKEQVTNITFAALLSEIGLLGLDTSIYSKPFNKLNFNQQEEFIAQTKMAQLILLPAVHLEPVMDIITSQFEYFNGKGPNQLTDKQIPLGAKILAVARDFWRYSLGRIAPEKLDKKEVFFEMKKFQGIRYDPAVLEVLFDDKDIISDTFMDTQTPLDALIPGMVLKQNVLTESHILVLPEGHVFSQATINKLVQFEASQKVSLTVFVE